MITIYSQKHIYFGIQYDVLKFEISKSKILKFWRNIWKLQIFQNTPSKLEEWVRYLVTTRWNFSMLLGIKNEVENLCSVFQSHRGFAE